MAKAKRFSYIVDDLTPEKAETIARGLDALTFVKSLKIDIKQSLLEVVSLKNPDSNVEMACRLSGTILRAKVKKRKL
jgi:hypothetical protein